jgi:NitT/TauT family transport system substrate-binding protein
MKNKFVKTIFVLFSVALIAGCAPKKTESAVTGAKAAVKIEKFNIIANPDLTASPLSIIAWDRGYFAEEGIDPNFIFLRNGRAEALSAGKGDIYLQELIPPLVYASQGAPIKIIGGTLSGGNYVICKAENAEKYSTLEGWKGARLGTVRLSTSEMISRYAVAQAGLDPETDVHFTEIDNYPNIVEAVRKGQVDIGFIGGGPYRQSALDLGLSILFPMNYLTPNYLCCRLNAYTPSLETKRELFVSFLVAYLRAWKDFNDMNQREVITKMFATRTSQTEEFITEMVFDSNRNGERSYNPDPDRRRIINVWDTLKATGYIKPEGIDINDVVDVTVYKDALDEVRRRYPDEPLYDDLLEYYEENDE